MHLHMLYVLSGWQKWHGVFCQGRQKMACDVLSRVTKTAKDVLSGVSKNGM